MADVCWYGSAYACYYWWWEPVQAENYDQENVCFWSTTCYVRRDEPREIKAAVLSWYTFDHREFTDAFWYCRCVSSDTICLKIWTSEDSE